MYSDRTVHIQTERKNIVHTKGQSLQALLYLSGTYQASFYIMNIPAIFIKFRLSSRVRSVLFSESTPWATLLFIIPFIWYCPGWLLAVWKWPGIAAWENSHIKAMKPEAEWHVSGLFDHVSISSPVSSLGFQTVRLGFNFSDDITLKLAIVKFISWQFESYQRLLNKSSVSKWHVAQGGLAAQSDWPR